MEIVLKQIVKEIKKICQKWKLLMYTKYFKSKSVTFIRCIKAIN